MFERTDHFIAGRWVDANGGETVTLPPDYQPTGHSY